MGKRKKQQGMILFITLIILASMTLTAISLVRTVDSSTLLAANLAFRQSATMAADAGLKTAIDWLGSNSSGTFLHTDQLSASTAYWASAQNSSPAFDPLTYNWDASNRSVCIDNCNKDAAGNTKRYVIHRLCELAGNPIGIACVRPPSTSGSTNNSSKGVVSGNSLPMTATAAAYYRVTIRVTGPRNTTSYIQAIVY